ncbi:MAG: hypothetical protein H0U74_18830 [Bradymonadaceae bacterium]|nr:hypothetical protein [Lujinxingiaceae bacterium]
MAKLKRCRAAALSLAISIVILGCQGQMELTADKVSVAGPEPPVAEHAPKSDSPPAPSPAPGESDAGHDIAVRFDIHEPLDTLTSVQQPIESGDVGEANTADASAPGKDSLAFLKRDDMRALWLWNELPRTSTLLANAQEQDALFAFAAAPHGDMSRALNRLFFEAREKHTSDVRAELFAVTYDPLTDEAHRPNLRAFLRRAKARGVAVEYLGGQAIWVASDDNAAAGIRVCEDLVSFNASTPALEERFDGVHLDIEPHTLDSGPYAGLWWENRLPNGYNADWTARWKHILTSCKARFDAYYAESGHRLSFSSDVGTDYAFYNKPILEFLNRSDGPLDYITIMNYYDDRLNSQGKAAFVYGAGAGELMVGGVAQNLALWSKLPVLIGVETGPTSIAPDEDSFFQEGWRPMYKVLDAMHADFAKTQLIGWAVHHYAPQSFRDLCEHGGLSCSP